MLNTFIDELRNIRINIKILKPSFKLASLNTKIIKKKEELANLKKEIETFKFEEEIINIGDIYVLKNKDKINFVFKKFAVLKDNININDYQGTYKGYFIDIFNKEVICHFKETVDYENDTFEIKLLDSKASINSINDYILITDSINGKITRSSLKKIYLKLTKK